jgi:hypothetical protein
MITVWPSLYRPGEGCVVSDRVLIERAKAPRAYTRKDDVPRWSGAVFRDNYRDAAHFERAGWLVLDFDKGATLEQINGAFDAFGGIAHTTWTPGRWRVAVRLDREVTTHEDEFGRCWRALAAVAERAGLEPDLAAKSPAHCFALPARHEGAHYEFGEFDGAFFDVDAALATFPKPQPLPQRASLAHCDHDALIERARRYLERMPGAISGSGGHARTFKAACVLIRGFDLEADDALRLLVEIHNPMCAPEWSERELVHKVRQAEQRGRLPHGYLAERGRTG